jgi:hypothetical protein
LGITVGKALAMLELVRRCSGVFRDPLLLGPFMCHLCAQSLSTQVLYGGLFMTCMSIGLSLRSEKKSIRIAGNGMDGHV